MKRRGQASHPGYDCIELDCGSSINPGQRFACSGYSISQMGEIEVTCDSDDAHYNWLMTTLIAGANH